MADASPFDEQPQYDDAPVDDVEQEEKEEEEQEDDPFADVPAPSGGSSMQPALDAEPEPEIPEETALSIWEKERAEVLRERQAKADAEKAQQLATAREEIDKFYADAASRLEKNKKVNRADEKAYRSDTAAIFANGTKWEKVNRLVNIAPKTGEKPGSSRVERYRKLLIQLKAEKEKKKTAAA